MQEILNFLNNIIVQTPWFLAEWFAWNSAFMWLVFELWILWIIFIFYKFFPKSWLFILFESFFETIYNFFEEILWDDEKNGLKFI